MPCASQSTLRCAECKDQCDKLLILVQGAQPGSLVVLREREGIAWLTLTPSDETFGLSVELRLDNRANAMKFPRTLIQLP